MVEVVYEPDERHSGSAASDDDEEGDSGSGSAGYVDIAGQFKG